MRGAIYVEGSDNSKLNGSQKIDTTYTSIKNTCSTTCPLKKNKTCYAMNSFVGITVRRLDKKARQNSSLDLARAEAKCINNSYSGKAIPLGRALRIHTAGDSKTRKGTRLIAGAVKKWKQRGGGDAFTYTHSWNHVPRHEWGCVSVLASIESIDQVELVRAKGYAPAIVVAEHIDSKAYMLPNSAIRWIPCPAQTKPGGKEVGCSDCKLCMKADWLFETNRGIAFAAHGIMTNKLKRHLAIIQ